MDRTILTWNFTNWITVLLMVLVGTAILGALASLIGVKIPGVKSSNGA
jgi:hypothetical protein